MFLWSCRTQANQCSRPRFKLLHANYDFRHYPGDQDDGGESDTDAQSSIMEPNDASPSRSPSPGPGAGPTPNTGTNTNALNLSFVGYSLSHRFFSPLLIKGNRVSASSKATMNCIISLSNCRATEVLPISMCVTLFLLIRPMYAILMRLLDSTRSCYPLGGH